MLIGCAIVAILCLLLAVITILSLIEGISAFFSTPGVWTGVAVVLGAAGFVLLVWHAAHPN